MAFQWTIQPEVLSFLIFGLCISSCSDESSPSIAKSETIRKSLQEASELFVYEGLPHPTLETGKLNAELKRADVVKIGEHQVYSPKKKVPLNTAKRLKKILSSDESIDLFTTGKKCGDFHADYAISWLVGQEERYALICFGCKEMIYRMDETEYRYDLSKKPTEDSLSSQLAIFQEKRPRRGRPSGYIIVTGDVLKPSRIPIPASGTLTLAEAIEAAGGPNRIATWATFSCLHRN